MATIVIEKSKINKNKEVRVAPEVEREAIAQLGIAITQLSSIVKSLCDAGGKDSQQVKELIDLICKSTKTLSWTVKCSQEIYDKQIPEKKDDSITTP